VLCVVAITALGWAWLALAKRIVSVDIAQR
jgi:hypothetical protein